MTQPVVVFADAELVAVTAIRAFLAGRSEDFAQNVQVGTQLAPSVTPTRFVRVRRIGGRSSDYVIDAARLDVLIWHDTNSSRMALAQMVRGFLIAMIGTFSDTACYGGTDFMAPMQVPDPDDDTREIVMLSVQVSVRGIQLI